jgi:hypothetical protein
VRLHGQHLGEPDYMRRLDAGVPGIPFEGPDRGPLGNLAPPLSRFVTKIHHALYRMFNPNRGSRPHVLAWSSKEDSQLVLRAGRHVSEEGAYG